MSPSRRSDADAGAPRGRVLVVEDDPGVRNTVARMIEVLGYAVVAVSDGEQAEGLPRAPSFDIVVADLNLPGTPGHRLVERLRSRWPGLRAIVMSGYADAEEVHAGHRNGSWRLLQKPFSLEALAAELRGATDPGEGED